MDREGMNRVVIEEHQAGDLVFAQVYYLYILLEATLAYVIVPIAKVRDPSTVAISNRIVRKPAEHQQMQASTFSTNRKHSSPSWDTRYHASRQSRK